MKLTKQHLGLMVALNITEYTPPLQALQRFISRNVYLAFPEPSSYLFLGADGRLVSTLRSAAAPGGFLFYGGLPQNATSGPLLDAWDLGSDMYNNTLGKQLYSNVKYDTRTRPLFWRAINGTPNAVTWTGTTYSASGTTVDAYVFASFPYYPPALQGTASSLTGKALGVGSIGCGITWLSAFLVNQARPTHSVIFVVDRDGMLLGSSHASVVKITNVNGTQVTSAVAAKDSNDSRVAAGYTSCVTHRARSVSVGGQVFLCAVLPVTDDHGLDLRVALLTPRDLFFASVEASARTAKSKRDSSTKLTIGLCALVLVTSSASAMLITYFVTRPLTAMANDMAEVADMELSRGCNVSSCYSEIRAIQKQFVSMVDRLREYKTYIPASMFAALSVEKQAGAAVPGKDSASAAAATGEKARTSITRSTGSRESSSSSTANTGRASSNNAVGDRVQQQQRRVLGIGLSFRHATVCFVDTDRFHDRLAASSLRDVVQLHGRYVEVVAQAVVRSSGTVDSFHGDHVVASWNTFTPNVQHQAMACRAALEVQQAVSRLNSDQHVQPLSVRIGVASGQLAVGRMGCDSIRSLAVVGLPVSRALELAKHAKRCKACLLVDHVVSEPVRSTILLRPVDVVELEGVSGPRLLHELVREFAQADGEWMYVLHNQEKEQSHERFGQAFELVLRKEFAAAVRTLSDGSLLSPVASYVLDRIQKMQAAGNVLPVSLPAR
eukprot:TRINITY_DN6188_c0_g1_i1.p1 TRINITY_DN6188_c0_g1~~TRINITY_DN6188_c0_g1_i1.p1  ORF type:complete len:816 (+),score=134.00 TRINITY_DN6188_c0_g1_i1:283-2448(+)